MSESEMPVWENSSSNAAAHVLGDQPECKLCPDWLQNNGICRVHIALTAGDGTTPKNNSKFVIFFICYETKGLFSLKI